jgi:hypothetical protein
MGISVNGALSIKETASGNIGANNVKTNVP